MLCVYYMHKTEQQKNHEMVSLQTLKFEFFTRFFDRCDQGKYSKCVYFVLLLIIIVAFIDHNVIHSP